MKATEILENKHIRMIKDSVRLALEKVKKLPDEETRMLVSILDDLLLGKDTDSELYYSFDRVIGTILFRNKDANIQKKQSLVVVCTIASFCNWVSCGKFFYRTKPCKMMDEK